MKAANAPQADVLAAITELKSLVGAAASPNAAVTSSVQEAPVDAATETNVLKGT